MTPCNCHQYRSKPTSLEEVRARCDVSDHILPWLKFVASGAQGDLQVYRCRVCSSFWAAEAPFGINHVLGEKSAGRGMCLYIIGAVDEREWLKTSEPFTYDLKEQQEDQEFYEQLGSEDGIEECRKEDCARKRIKYSVMCRKHHFEMVRRRECVFP